jgi:nucleotide-binding universal stress UspA family protein
MLDFIARDAKMDHAKKAQLRGLNGGRVMEKRILVAIDESANALRAAQFVAQSFTPEHKISLFHVIMDTPAVCNMNSPELTPLFLEQQINLCSIEEKKRELVGKAMTEAKRLLRLAGFPEKNISQRMEKRQKGIARDIIAEAKKGYHAVVMGRRGLSGVAEFFIGSVSQKVLHGTKDLSVILVS